MRGREHDRIHPRLKGYDYGQAGAYFVTVCVKNRHFVLSEVVGRGLAPAVVRLLPFGKVVERELLLLPMRFPSVQVEKYVIMPNHVHVLFRFGETNAYYGAAGEHHRAAEAHLGAAGASPRPTLPQVVGAFKSLSTRAWKKEFGDCTDRLWQTSYHDHIIRNEADYLAHWTYIDENPARWAEDEYYCE